MTDARLIGRVALVIAVLGMALVVLAVIRPGWFFPGVYLLDLAAITLLAAGIVHVLTKPADET